MISHQSDADKIRYNHNFFSPSVSVGGKLEKVQSKLTFDGETKGRKVITNVSQKISMSKIRNKTQLMRRLSQQRASNYVSEGRMNKIHTIKQIYDTEVIFEFDELLNQGEHNTSYIKTKQKIKICSIIGFILIQLSVIITLIENQLHISNISNFIHNYGVTNISNIKSISPTVASNVLLSFNMLISISCSIVVVIIYIFRMRQYKIDMKIDKNDNLFSSGLWKGCGLKALICLIFYPPGVKGIIVFGTPEETLSIFSWNSVLTIVSMLKLLFLINLIRLFSEFSDDISKVICKNYNVKNSIMFSLKSLMKKHSLILICVFSFYIMAISSIIVRDFEFAYYEKGVNVSNTTTLTNSFWLMFSVLTTLSIGDYYPVTNKGNIFCVIAGIIGYYILTTLFFSLSEYSEFSFNEKKSFIKLKKILSGENDENKAANVIRCFILLRKKIINYRNSKKDKWSLNITYDQSSSYSRVEILQEIFGLACVQKLNIKLLKNEYMMAKNCGVPVDELIMNTSNKFQLTMDTCIHLMHKMKNVTDNLEAIEESQEAIQKRFNEIEEMQKDIEKYLVKINNRKVLYKIRERNHVDIQMKKKMSLPNFSTIIQQVTKISKAKTRQNEKSLGLKTTIEKGIGYHNDNENEIEKETKTEENL